MNLSGINRYSSIASYTVSKPTEKSDFKSVLQESQKTDTFTRTSLVDTGIAETQAKLDKVAAAGRAVDYSGMTKTEIYAEIENRYKEAFDDYYMARTVCATKEQSMMLSQYNDEIRNKIGIDNSFEFYNNARGYEGMSYDEIELTIKEKYNGKTGFQDQLNLFGELFTAGVLSNKYGHHTAASMITDMKVSMGCVVTKPKSEFYGGIDPKASAFDMLMNNEYVPAAHKETYQQIIEDILFGIPDFVK